MRRVFREPPCSGFAIRVIRRKLPGGSYRLPDSQVTAHHFWAEVEKKIFNGVVCLLSALRFHELTSQVPFEVWYAIDRKARQPRIAGLPLHIVRFSGEAMTAGAEMHVIDGVPVKIFNPAKTVADCFKYRNKIGLDLALEALKECRRNRLCENNDLWHFAKICRVGNVIRPYLEALSS